MEKYSHEVMAPLFREYSRIMQLEAKFNPKCKRFSTYPSILYQAANYIAEIAKNSILPRAWCTLFNLTDCQNSVPESVGAHTNLVAAMVDRALVSIYGPDYEPCTKVTEGYTYREIMEAVRLHDLPENAIGDWPDNGARDEEKKLNLETKYYDEFEKHYADIEGRFITNVRNLLKEMGEKKRPYSLGRLLYIADKAAAVIITLTYDDKKRNLHNIDSLDDIPATAAMMHEDYPNASKRDRAEMDICDFHEAGYHKASEMFTADILSIRKLNQYDDTGFFTGLIVMYTLMVNGRWYEWRERDYKEYLST